ncbi:MAG TPA: bifunctional UDP-N-acetylglucosamine diphosphorylase/glucosamine-1-phosphate N-acetyltransferase GlmU [Vicinamibacterales bacterium]
MASLHFVILAAGKGTRMKSERPKVLHAVGGEPMIRHLLRTVRQFEAATTTVVVGHMAETVSAALADLGVRTVLQEPQLGTGHALLQTESVLSSQTGTVVLLYGDVPMLSARTIERLLDHHQAHGLAATVLTAHLPNPVGLGRIVRDEKGRLVRIVEERDASPDERRITEFNSGIYAFELEGLFDALRRLNTSNAQGEYYLPDLITIYRETGRPVDALCIDDPRELRGVNSRAELAEMNAQIRDARNEAVMAGGVTLIDPATTWIGPDVVIGPDTVIHPNVMLEGTTRIGRDCEIHAGVRIINSTIEDGAVIQNYCVVRDSRIGPGVMMGPFSHIRPESDVEAGAHIGNFVELKKTRMGAGAKANHLAYLGDAIIGARVNIGAGTITCNYDGEKKHQTVIGEGAFIGSDSQLIAPVKIGAGAYVAAGSSITQDVPDGALAIARGRQENKPGWAERRKRSKPAK